MAKQIIVCLLAIILFAARSFANDSSAELATGGLILTKSDDIEMQSEDLLISMKEVRVQYHFYNHSDRNITTQIAFPMPDIPYGVDDFNFVIPTDDPQNILGFTTTVNNRPVAALVERKALLNGIDKTDILRNLGVPIAPDLTQKYNYLSQETWDHLVRLGLIQDTPKADGYIQPRWTLKTTYYWQQTFPAHQEVIIDHHYLPSVGETVPLPSVNLVDALKSQYYSRYCIDKSFLTAVAKPSNTMWEQHYLEYILVTGGNWSGPIKNFRLVVDKGSPENLVSFCGQRARQISETQFEVRQSQFIPTSNLSILVLSPAQPERSDVPNSNAQTNVTEETCDQLWYRRNNIFKAAGYCFHTSRAIGVFGNAGCAYDNEHDVPLSDGNRQAVDIIQREERVKHCSQ
jgi:hypothetical protein